MKVIVTGAAGGFGDHCSQNHRSSPWSANPDPATRGPAHLGDAQAAQTEALKRSHQQFKPEHLLY